MKPTKEQLRILRHMLGIDVNDRKSPTEYRDYYCATRGNSDLHELKEMGLVRAGFHDSKYEYFRTTDAGKAAARESQKALLMPKSKRIYRAYLRVTDGLHELSFRQFLTDTRFTDLRREV